MIIDAIKAFVRSVIILIQRNRNKCTYIYISTNALVLDTYLSKQCCHHSINCFGRVLYLEYYYYIVLIMLFALLCCILVLSTAPRISLA
jgi:hypothetical protein